MGERAEPSKEKARIPRGDHVAQVLGEKKSSDAGLSFSLSALLDLEPLSFNIEILNVYKLIFVL